MPHPDVFMPGMVWLVGAGPGDPDLLTRKAERLLREAEIVFYDALVGDGVLALAGCELVSVGKRSGRHSKGQEQINDLLLAAARSGKRVVRLKGGDPSIFGRAAEELDHLAAHGIDVRICPGITSASAAAASGLASLTLRGSARKLTFATAHDRNGQVTAQDYASLADPAATLAIYMGRSAAGNIARSLIAAGRSADTPVMVAVNVSRSDERIIHGRLGALGFLVRAISQDAPTLLLIGEAVATRAEAPQPSKRVAAMGGAYPHQPL